MVQDDLEDWALRVMQVLQDFCDEAQEAAGSPDGEDQLLDVRALMQEYELIASGKPVWQLQLANSTTTEVDQHTKYIQPTDYKNPSESE